MQIRDVRCFQKGNGGIRDKSIMNNKLKELIQPYWVEEQQGVYIPLINKVLLKDNVPAQY